MGMKVTIRNTSITDSFLQVQHHAGCQVDSLLSTGVREQGREVRREAWCLQSMGLQRVGLDLVTEQRNVPDTVLSLLCPQTKFIYQVSLLTLYFLSSQSLLDDTNQTFTLATPEVLFNKVIDGRCGNKFNTHAQLLFFHFSSLYYSNTLVQKHQFFSAQLSSQSNSHIHT